MAIRNAPRPWIRGSKPTGLVTAPLLLDLPAGLLHKTRPFASYTAKQLPDGRGVAGWSVSPIRELEAHAEDEDEPGCCEAVPGHRIRKDPPEQGRM